MLCFVHAFCEGTHCVAFLKGNRRSSDDRPDIHTFIRHPMNHDARLNDLASCPRVKRTLNSFDTRKLARLRWMQIDDGKRCANVGSQYPHPSGENHKVRRGRSNDLDQPTVILRPLLGCAATVFNYLVMHSSCLCARHDPSLVVVRDYRNDVCLELTACTRIE